MLTMTVTLYADSKNRFALFIAKRLQQASVDCKQESLRFFYVKGEVVVEDPFKLHNTLLAIFSH